MVKIKHIALTVLFASIAFIGISQNMLDADSNVIVKVSTSNIYTPDNEIIFSFQGNIIFEGNSSKPEDIYFTLDNANANQKGKINVYDGQGRTGKWWLKKQQIFHQKLQSDYVAARYSYTSDYLAFYNGITDSLLAYVPQPDTMTASQVFALFQIVWHRFNLKEEFEASHTNPLPAGLENVVAYMEPTFGGGLVWVWDGVNLYPANDGNQYLVWNFDGRKLEPKIAPQTHEEWQWDGDTFKPYWGGHPRNNWVWNGNLLRQIWDANFNKEFVYEDGIIRPRFGAFGDNEWRVVGEMPKAIVTAVALGVLYR